VDASYVVCDTPRDQARSDPVSPNCCAILLIRPRVWPVQPGRSSLRWTSVVVLGTTRHCRGVVLKRAANYTASAAGREDVPLGVELG